MFDRMIFKGYLSGLYKQDNVRCFLWSQGVALKDFTPYAKATTERSPTTPGDWPPRRAARSSPSTM